jgi:hypothetical protein
MNKKGFSMTETMIAGALMMIFVLAAMSLMLYYKKQYTGLAKSTTARSLGLQVVSEMKSHHGRYPRAQIGGANVIYRKCYDQSLNVVPDATGAVRLLTNATVDECTTSFQVDIVPDTATPKLYQITVNLRSVQSGIWEQKGVYRLSF